MFDTSGLTPTSTKRTIRWRDTALTFVWLRADGRVVVAFNIADKLEAVQSCGREDRILAVRSVKFPAHQEVLVVDDLDAARDALEGRA